MQLRQFYMAFLGFGGIISFYGLYFFGDDLTRGMRWCRCCGVRYGLGCYGSRSFYVGLSGAGVYMKGQCNVSN